jgi:inhibitor of the pro-sigma K processing machinery
LEKYFLLGIIVVGSIIFISSLIRHKQEAFLNFVLRIVVGVLAIYCVNTILDNQGIATGVGINGFNLLTIGLLGLPGFILVYGTAFYLKG